MKRSVILFFIFLLISACKGNIAGKTYKIGFMICNSEKETKERFEPLIEYLKKRDGLQLCSFCYRYS